MILIQKILAMYLLGCLGSYALLSILNEVAHQIGLVVLSKKAMLIGVVGSWITVIIIVIPHIKKNKFL